MTFHVKHPGLDAEWHAAISAARFDPSPRALARVAVLANMRRVLALEAHRELEQLREDARNRAPSDDENDNAERRFHAVLLDDEE
jgi:hypothetical protein